MGSPPRLVSSHALPADIARGFASVPDDLALLQNINRQKIEALVQELNTTAPAELHGKDLVVVISTGGTISMRKDSKGVLVPDLDFNGIFQRVNQKLHEHFYIKGLDAFRLDSSQMNFSHPRDLVIAMAYIWKHVRQKLSGFLVLHGTDTMSYSGAAVSLMMGPGLPFSVVFTGAQKPIQDPINDAMMNLRNALFTLQTLHTNDMAEVVIVMGDRCILATSSEKVDDTQANAFAAHLHKYVAHFNRLEYPITLAEWLKPRRRVTFAPTVFFGDYSHVLIVKSVLGLSPDMVARQVADPHVQAVILYSHGAGTIHEEIIRSVIPEARRKKAPVFVISPVHANFKTTYESGLLMMEQGVIPLFMTLSAALIKIEIALRMYADDHAQLAQFMTANYVGEVPTEKSRYEPTS